MSKFLLINRKKKKVKKFNEEKDIIDFLWGKDVKRYILIKNESNVNPDLEICIPGLMNGEKETHFPLLIEFANTEKRVIDNPKDIPTGKQFKVLETSFNG
jgi:hypothetical protein